jgi:hypothetical protein
MQARVGSLVRVRNYLAVMLLGLLNNRLGYLYNKALARLVITILIINALKANNTRQVFNHQIN